MVNKKEILNQIDNINAKYSQSPIVKGLVDGGLSLIPFLGTAVTSALETRSAQIYEKNSRQFIEEVKVILGKLDESKIDKTFIESDEFVSLLIEILTRNARTYEKEKITLYARLFVNATTYKKSTIMYKEGFVRIIDELSTTHILFLALIHEKSLKFTDKDQQDNRDYVSAIQIADETGTTIARVQAYCDQMIRFGLLRDWGIGRIGYTQGEYSITVYGNEFAEFLTLEIS